MAKVTKRDHRRILDAQTPEEQEKFFDEIVDPWFNNWVIRNGGKLPLALYSLGIPPQQFKAMEDEEGMGIIENLRTRVRRLVCDFPVSENYFCWQAFSRSYDSESRQAIPEYLKEENWQTLRDNLDRVHPHVTTTVDFMRTQPEGSLDRFVFLDSQDWMNAAQITEQWSEVARVGRPGSRVIFRTAAAPSPIEEALPAELMRRFTYEKDLSADLFRRDRSAIYGGFHLYVLDK